MNTNRNTDQLFERMRDMPVELPLENVEKFVIAQAALGITAVGASKGIFTKAFLKFHLNSILMITTTITAAVIGLAVWTSHGDKMAAQTNSKQPKQDHFTTLAPSLKLDADTPKTVTVKAIANGENVSVTTVNTETGTNIKIVSGDSQTSVYYNTPNDSTYVFAYATDKDYAVAAAPVDAEDPVFAIYSSDAMASLDGLDAEIAQLNAELGELSAMPAMCCSYNDTLLTTVEKALFKDGLISDTTHYSFKINGSYMKVNGEKMSKEHWRKYKELIESSSLNRVNKNFSYAVSKDGEDVTIRVENYVN
jgi:hypothetical protein